MKPQLTLEAFADWCEKQPADKRYEYYDIHNCAICQFAKSIGFPSALATGQGFHVNSHEDDGRYIALLPSDSEAAGAYPWTFGDLAARLRAAA